MPADMQLLLLPDHVLLHIVSSECLPRSARLRFFSACSQAWRLRLDDDECLLLALRVAASVGDAARVASLLSVPLLRAGAERAARLLGLAVSTVFCVAAAAGRLSQLDQLRGDPRLAGALRRHFAAGGGGLHATLARVVSAGHVEVLRSLACEWRVTAEVCANDRCYLARLAAEWNQPDTLRVLIEHYGLAPTECGGAVQAAARHGRVDFLRALRLELALDLELARLDRNAALRSAAALGRIAVLRELRAWGLGADDARALDNEALRCAATAGHVGVLEELATGWGLLATDAVARENEALRFAARGGHVRALRALRALWGLGASDARARSNEALRWAAQHGHLAVLRSLRVEWQLTRADARSGENEALRSAARDGRVSVLRELREGWSLTADDARALSNEALLGAFAGRRFEVQRELRHGWKLGAADARALGNAALQRAFRMSDAETMRTLRAEWGLGREDALGSKLLRLAAMSVPRHASESHVALRELASGWELTADDARADDNAALADAVKLGNVEVLQALRVDFGLGAADARGGDALHLAVTHARIGAMRELRLWGLTDQDAASREHRLLNRAARMLGTFGLVQFEERLRLQLLLLLRREWGVPYAADACASAHCGSERDVLIARRQLFAQLCRCVSGAVAGIVQPERQAALAEALHAAVVWNRPDLLLHLRLACGATSADVRPHIGALIQTAVATGHQGVLAAVRAEWGAPLAVSEAPPLPHRALAAQMRRDRRRALREREKLFAQMRGLLRDPELPSGELRAFRAEAIRLATQWNRPDLLRILREECGVDHEDARNALHSVTRIASSRRLPHMLLAFRRERW